MAVYILLDDQVYSNTRSADTSQRVNTNQHESDTSQYESKRVNTS